MKKRIVFMLINMNVGGTEKALLNMISEMPANRYDITILMLEKYGGFLNEIPNTVNVEYIEEYPKIKFMLNNPPKITAMTLLKGGKLFKGMGYIIMTVLSKLLKSKGILFGYLLKEVQNLKDKYDIAIAYAGPMDFISYFVVKKIKAKTKIQWIHFDITKVAFDVNFATGIYKEFDKFIVVSEQSREKFLKIMPNLKNRTEVFQNMVSSSIIHKQSKKGKGFDDQFDGIRILTVGRLTTEKAQDIAIKAFAKLVHAGYHARWYCIGEGSSRNKYERLIETYNLEGKFILLGSDPNPYPYMEQCDIYVQPSRHEGYCLTIAEARCLKKPIVTTATAGGKEQIVHGETGLISEINEQEILKNIIKLIENPGLRLKLSKGLQEEIDSKFISDQFAERVVRL